MELLAIIDQQHASRFTGKINVLKKENGQFLGAILLSEGLVVGANYQQKTGENAIFSMLCDGLGTGARYVVEPEVVESSSIQLCTTARDIQLRLKTILTALPKIKKLIPPGHLHLLIDSEFVIDGADLNSREFSLLTVISDYSKVEEIYRYSPFAVTDTTEILVKLRKMKALKVVSD